MKTYNAPYTELVTIRETTILCATGPSPAPGVIIQGTPGELNDPDMAPMRYF